MDRLADLGGTLDGVTSDKVAAGTEFTRSGRPFALVTDDVVELRLPPDVAEAASRTPSTTMSSRGPDWIRFAPLEWDDHARDRLDAWFRLAWRAAAK